MSHSFSSARPETGGHILPEAGSRLPLYRNPVRLAASASPWLSARYLLGCLIIGGAVTAGALTAAGTAATLALTLAGIALVPAAARIVRRCADVERRRLRLVVTQPVRGGYAPVTGVGALARAVGHWRDPAIRRDLKYLGGLWLPLSIVDAVVLGLWGWFIGMITLPAWYWAPWMDVHGTRIHGYQLGFWFPHGPDGPGTVGVFIDTLPKALIAAAVGLAGFLATNYLLVVTARAHARVARAMLRPPSDPLAAAKEVRHGRSAIPAQLSSVRGSASVPSLRDR